MITEIKKSMIQNYCLFEVDRDKLLQFFLRIEISEIKSRMLRKTFVLFLCKECFGACVFSTGLYEKDILVLLLSLGALFQEEFFALPNN